MKSRFSFRELGLVAKSRIGLRISIAVFLSILAVEAIILIPSYKNYERDLVEKVNQSSLSTFRTGLNIMYQQSGRIDPEILKLIQSDAAILGGRIFDTDGKTVAAFGNPPIALQAFGKVSGSGFLMTGKTHIDFLWKKSTTSLPVDIAARVDTSWIERELLFFLLRIAGLVLLISSCVVLVTMAALGHMIITPVLTLHDRLNAAKMDPENAHRQIDPEPSRKDELGDMIQSLNDLLGHVSRAHDAKLKKKDERFYDFARAASDLFWETSADHKFSYISEKFREITDHSPNDYIGKPIHSLFLFSASRETRRVFWTSLRQSKPFRNLTFHLTRQDGSEFYLAINGTPYYDMDGNFAGYRGSGVDISDQMNAQRALVSAKEAAEISNRTKSEFLANMSHELRTPLNAIIGFSEMVTTEAFGPIGNRKYSDYVRDINDAGRLLLDIINDILDLSKIEIGHLELRKSEISIVNLINACVKIIEPRAQEKNIHISFDAEAWRTQTLLADEIRLKQMLINLLSNAVKFTPPEGRIEIGVSFDRDKGLSISVTDNGIGISPEDQGRILNPFTQVDSSLNRVYEGTGLGLPLTMAFIELHGGKLAILSDLEQGTRATLTFPPGPAPDPAGNKLAS